MGFEKIKSYQEQAKQWKSWVRSGNYLTIGNKIINDPDHVTPAIFG